MNTVEEAKKLWCPMARVAQIGVVETGAAYNRALSKTHRTVKATWSTPDTFELGQDDPGTPHEITILDMQAIPSGASSCLADWCACWRWSTSHYTEDRKGYCGLAGRPEVIA